MDKLMAALFGVALVLVLIILMSLLLAVVTQCAWANSVAMIFHLKELDFWQAFWLNVLSGVLFKSSVSSK